MPTFHTTIVREAEETTEIEVDYAFSPGTPGRLYGRPEDCYPPEAADIDVVRAWIVQEDGTEVEEELADDEIDQLREEGEVAMADARAEAEIDRYESSRDDDRWDDRWEP